MCVCLVWKFPFQRQRNIYPTLFSTCKPLYGILNWPLKRVYRICSISRPDPQAVVFISIFVLLTMDGDGSWTATVQILFSSLDGLIEKTTDNQSLFSKPGNGLFDPLDGGEPWQLEYLSCSGQASLVFA